MHMTSSTRATIVALALTVAAPLLGACSTTAGAGQDLSATGHAITRSADQVKSGL